MNGILLLLGGVGVLVMVFLVYGLSLYVYRQKARIEQIVDQVMRIA